MSERKLRVVQWATGTVGKAAMRAVIGHPQMELVGAKVYSESKDGMDAGEICGAGPIGVKATRNIEDILALKPDCVVYMPESSDMDDVCRLLESGCNIASTRAEFFNPERMDGALRERIEAACQKGGATVHTSGSSPGFITEALPIVLLSLQRRLDLLTVEEFANCIDGCSEQMLIEIMGFGEAPDAYASRTYPDRDVVFADSLTVVADAIGMPIDSFETEEEYALTREPTLLHETTIDAGTVGGQRYTVTGLHNGKPVLRFRCNWFVTDNLDADWNLREDGWRVTVEGDTPLDISIGFPMGDTLEERQATLPNLTAHRPVNAIPAICAARPGMLTTADLPQIIARLG